MPTEPITRRVERASCNHCHSMHETAELLELPIGKPPERPKGSAYSRGTGRTMTVRICRRCAAELVFSGRQATGDHLMQAMMHPREEALRAGLFVCHECKDENCRECIGIPCMCPCPLPEPEPDYSI